MTKAELICRLKSLEGTYARKNHVANTTTTDSRALAPIKELQDLKAALERNAFVQFGARILPAPLKQALKKLFPAGKD